MPLRSSFRHLLLRSLFWPFIHFLRSSPNFMEFGSVPPEFGWHPLDCIRLSLEVIEFSSWASRKIQIYSSRKRVLNLSQNSLRQKRRLNNECHWVFFFARIGRTNGKHMQNHTISPVLNINEQTYIPDGLTAGRSFFLITRNQISDSPFGYVWSIFWNCLLSIFHICLFSSKSQKTPTYVDRLKNDLPPLRDKTQNTWSKAPSRPPGPRAGSAGPDPQPPGAPA